VTQILLTFQKIIQLTTVYAVEQVAIVCTVYIRTLFFPITYVQYTCTLFRKKMYGPPCRPGCIDPRRGWTASSLENIVPGRRPWPSTHT